MFDEKNRLWSMEEQGRRLDVAFRSAESTAPARRPRRRRAFIAVGVTALAAVVLASVAVVGRHGGGPLTLNEAVAAVVRVAADQPGSQPGKYLHIKTESSQLGGGHGAKPLGFSSESWYRDGDPTYWTRTTLFSKGGKDSISATCQLKVPPGVDLNRTQIDLPKGAPFPKTSEEAYRVLRGSNDDDPDGLYSRDSKAWDQLGLAMMGGAADLTPEQRSVLIGALAYVPGAKTLGRTIDPRGNEAIGFERVHDGYRDLLYFDAETSVLTYFAKTLAKPNDKWYPGVKVGTPIQTDGVVEFRYLDALPPLKEYSPGKVRFDGATTDMGDCQHHN